MVKEKDRSAKEKRVAQRANRELVLKALTNPKFRKQLAKDPTAALKKEKLSKVQIKEVELVLEVVKGVEAQMNGMADKLLCACGVIV